MHEQFWDSALVRVGCIAFENGAGAYGLCYYSGGYAKVGAFQKIHRVYGYYSLQALLLLLPLCHLWPIGLEGGRVAAEGGYHIGTKRYWGGGRWFPGTAIMETTHLFLPPCNPTPSKIPAITTKQHPNHYIYLPFQGNLSLYIP